MVRKLALAVSLAVGSLPMSVYALGMGGMKTHSALNEKFKADIELVSVEKGMLDTLKIRLAPAEVFARVGLERSFFLTRLKFQPIRLKNGKAIIRVSSDEPIREPFLDFFVKMDWPNGQVVREYTALLDPPVVTKRSAPRIKAASSQSSVTRTRAASAPAPAQALRADQVDGEYGPIQANETLWEIADSLATDGVSVHQMMMALYKANPNAFLRNNINLLKKGKMLQVPSAEEAASLAQRQAVAEFQQQAQGWMSNTDTVAEASSDAAAAAPTASTAADGEEVQLKITGTPAEQSADSDASQAVSDLKVEQGGADLKQRMLLLEEEAETARQEAVQLRSQLDDAQQQLEDSKRLLKLQNEELARLRQGLSQADMAASEAATASAIAETADTTEDISPIEEARLSDATDASEASASEIAEEAGAAVADTSETISSEVVEEAATESTDYLADTSVDTATSGEEMLSEDTTEVIEESVTEEAQNTETVATAEEQASTESMAETAPAENEATPAEEEVVADVNADASLLDKTLSAVQNNWQLAAAGAGGGVLLLSLLAVAAGRRKKKSAASAAAYMDDDSVDQESILLEEESSLAETVADSMAAGTVGDTSFLSEYSTEEFKNLQEDTAEVDPVSEADVYIAYGRYQQAEEILNEAMAAGNDSASVKYKMLEVHYATQKKEAFSALADEMVQSGQYQEDPKAWEHIQTMGRDLDKNNPLFSAEAAAAGVGAAAVAAAAVNPASEEVGDDSELSLDLSTLAEEVDSVLNVDSEPLDGFSELDLDFSSLQAEDADAATGTDDSLNMEDFGAGGDDALGETELHTELLDITELGDVNVGSTNLDDALADLSGDLEGVMADSQILDEPLDLEDDRFSTLDEDITPDSQISGLEDDLDVSVGEDSVIGDEVETKLELAKAFMEIGDADGARSILQEVEDDGTPEQKEVASQLLGQIDD